MKRVKKCCFFIHEPLEELTKEQYSQADIRILSELGYVVTVATKFTDVPLGSDFYFSWWACGSILPLIKAKISNRKIIVVAGGQETMLTIDSVTNRPYGYMASPWYKKVATKISLRYASAIVVVSNHMVKDAMALGARNVRVVPNCVDVDRFCDLDLPRKYVTIVFNSNKNSISLKRGENFIRSIPLVLKYFPQQQFRVVGEKGNLFAEVSQLIKSLGIEQSIEFSSMIANTEMPRVYNESLVYVQISESETFGLAVAEAMGCCTPVVVSKKGALPEVVGDCGFFVDNNSPMSIAEGVMELLKLDATERTGIGLKCRQRIIENYSFEKRKQMLCEIINDIAN